MLKDYSLDAKKFGDSSLSTMNDQFIRKKEIEFIKHSINSYQKKTDNEILDMGCGNGYLLSELSKLPNNYTGIDLNQEMIEIAKNRNLSNCDFFKHDINKKLDKKFDIIISERCIVNIKDWEAQKKVFLNLFEMLKDDGFLILVEGFKDGLDRINKARNEIGLENIPEPTFNRYFDEKKFKETITKQFEIVLWENFTSTYYFFSRVLYPKLTNHIEYNSTFCEFFSQMPNFGNYGMITGIVLLKTLTKKV